MRKNDENPFPSNFQNCRMSKRKLMFLLPDLFSEFTHKIEYFLEKHPINHFYSGRVEDVEEVEVETKFVMKTIILIFREFVCGA